MKEKIITKKILKWYDLNKRSLPWRKKVSLEKKQYYTLVSEFMLQQTQVTTVIPFFNRFIKNLPSINSLAKVNEKKLIKLWEGLGYYSRARNLKKTAQFINRNFKGKLPNNLEDLFELETSKWRDLDSTEKELVLLKNLWDIKSIIISSYGDWKRGLS